MADKFSENYIDSARFDRLPQLEEHSLMSDLLEFNDPASPLALPLNPPLTPAFPSPPALPPLLSTGPGLTTSLPLFSSPSRLTPQFSSYLSTLLPIFHELTQDLESNLHQLMSLNPSRRESIAQYLDLLAGQQPSSSLASSSSAPPSAGGELKKRLEGKKTAVQLAALKTFLEEVALIALGQILLLKSWSDRGIRKWCLNDLGRLNWALSSTLKSALPLDREGWQITRPNLYSWYNPSKQHQADLWNNLEKWNLDQEGSALLRQLLQHLRKSPSLDGQASGRYDFRFFESLWPKMESFGFDASPEGMKRKKVIFTPTLRDGALLRSGPKELTWIGLEASAFQFMISELMILWRGPIPPPLWAIGTGLEVHSRDQLTFLSQASKPSLYCRIAEMEACQAAFILEETILRAQSRQAACHTFREQLEGLPYFKKIKASGTSLGTLQACVALTKLRPGGILLWAREEPLTSKEGSEALHFLLDRARLNHEWDFSQIEHQLPHAEALFPKHLYLFQKELQLEARHSHRPTRHVIEGSLRSHVELPLLLEDAFAAIESQNPPRGHWSVISHVSPHTQRDWMDKWPDPTCHRAVRRLNQLRQASLPLAQITTIRPTPEGDPKRGGTWSLQLALKGFWIKAELTPSGQRKLAVYPLPAAGENAKGQGFFILFGQEEWLHPLKAYLSSQSTQTWLDHHAERKGDRWLLKEQVVKWIPIPKNLLKQLPMPLEPEAGLHSQLKKNWAPASSSSNDHDFLPDLWQQHFSEIDTQPKAIMTALQNLPPDEPAAETIHAACFVAAAKALGQLETSQNRLLGLVSPEGKLRWKEILAILPETEVVSLTQHPKIRLIGSLPPHLTITRMDRVKSPTAGVLLTTEAGFNLQLACSSSLLLSLLLDQLEGYPHPTWLELVENVRLPRKIEFAEATALDVLNAHAQQTSRLQEFHDLLSSCQLF